jgi:Fe-S cluster assembly scaffold protein SufB
MLKLSVVFSLLMGFSNLIWAQEQEIKKSEVPEAVLETFKQKFPDQKPKGWIKDSNIYQIAFQNNEKWIEVTFQEDGKWLHTKSNTVYANMPEDIKNTFDKSKYADWEIHQCFEVESSESKNNFYEIQLIDVEGELFVLLLNSKGEFIRESVAE